MNNNCTISDSGSTTTEETNNLAIVRRWIEGMNGRDLSVIDSIVAEDAVDHHLPPGIPAGRAGIALWCAGLVGALELHLDVHDMFADGDRVAVRSTVSGRHVGEFGGLPPTDRAFSVSMMSIERVVAGRIVERWENVDTATMLQQLGV